jgi:sugar lactone lactonase YvrE
MNPWGVALDTGGDLFIADQINARVRKVSAKTKIITTVAGSGTAGFSGDGGAAISAEINVPQGITLDSENNLYIPDNANNRVRMVSQKTQAITTVAGGGTVGDGGPATKAILASPSLVSFDAAGNYFISDQANNLIRRVDAHTAVITTLAGNGIAGYSGDGGPATSASISTPVWGGVAADRSGNLFIGDTYNMRVRRVDAISGIITTFAGNGNFCSPGTASCGDGGPATGASFGSIGGVALDSHGDLFISDFSTQRIRRVDANTGIITTVAGNGNVCSTSTDPCGDGGPASLATFNSPWGIAFDKSNNLYIVDVGDNRIRSVNAGTQIINTVAFNGNPTFGGDGGPALNASMQNPYEVAVDSSGNFFVSGGYDEVVRRIDAATGTVVTVAGNASNPLYFGFSGDGGPATRATLSSFGLAIGKSGNLLIADGVNGRIRQVDLVSAVSLSANSLSFPAQMVGTSSAPETVTLTNSGSATLGITSISITGTDAGDYSQTNTCGPSLAPSLNCTVTVTFSPRAKGTRTAALAFNGNAANCGEAGPQTIALSGTGQ